MTEERLKEIELVEVSVRLRDIKYCTTDLIAEVRRLKAMAAKWRTRAIEAEAEKVAEEYHREDKELDEVQP